MSGVNNAYGKLQEFGAQLHRCQLQPQWQKMETIKKLCNRKRGGNNNQERKALEMT